MVATQVQQGAYKVPRLQVVEMRMRPKDGLHNSLFSFVNLYESTSYDLENS